MPQGSIRAAGAGIQTPPQGSVTQDLSKAFASFLAGVQEQERYDEEQRLRQAQLAIEQQRADAATVSAEAELEAAETGTKRLRMDKLYKPQEMKIQEIYADAQRTMSEATMERLQTEKDNLLVQAAGARRLLVSRYGMDPDLAANLKLEDAVDHLQHEYALELAQERSRAEVYSSNMIGLSELLRGTTPIMAEQKARYEQAQADFAAFRNNIYEYMVNPDTGQIIPGAQLPPDVAARLTPEQADQIVPLLANVITNPVEDETVWLELYKLAKKPQWDLLQVTQSAYESSTQNLNQIQDNMNTLLQQSFEAGVPLTGGTVMPYGDGYVGGAGQYERAGSGVAYSQMAPGPQLALRNVVAEQVREDQESFVARLGYYQRLGVPVDEIVADAKGMTVQEFVADHERRTQEAAQGSVEGLSDSIAASQQALREFGALPTGVPQTTYQERERAKGAIQKAILEGMHQNDFTELVKSFVSEGILSRQEALDAVAPEDEKGTRAAALRYRLEWRIPKRLDRTGGDKPRGRDGQNRGEK